MWVLARSRRSISLPIPLIDLLLVFAPLHVNEIQHDQVPPCCADEAGADLVGGFQVEPAEWWSPGPGRRLCAGRFDVNGDQGLRFINHDVTAALEIDLAGEGGFQLAGDVEAVKRSVAARCRA